MMNNINAEFNKKMPPLQLKKFELRTHTNRLLKLNETTSKKLYELECQNLYNDE